MGPPGIRNEDKYANFKLSLPSCDKRGPVDFELYSTFDGHGGYQASELCAEKLE
jgi:serine/threonine protein phosphatase PrpC